MSDPVEQVWHSYKSRLLSFVRQQVGDQALAEDIVQEVFIRMVDKLDTLKADDRMVSWLYQVTRNVIADHFRKSRPEVALPEDIPLSDDDPLLPTRQGLEQCLKGMIATLPEEYRQAVVLSELDGMPQQELADLLGISLSGAKSRVQRGRKMLREKMQHCCELERDQQGSVVDYSRRNNDGNYC